MGSYEAGTESDLDQTYGWVAARQLELMGQADSGQVVSAAGETATRAVIEDVPVVQESLADRFPLVSGAYSALSRSSRHADHVPNIDRDAFVGGKSALIDEATIEVLEAIFGTRPEGLTVTVQAEATEPATASFLARAGRSMLAQAGRARARQTGKAEQARRAQELKDLATLFRLYPDDPDKAIAILRKGQASDDDIARAQVLLAAYADDPEATLAAMNAARELDPQQRRRLGQHEVGMEMSRMRADRDDRGKDGLGVRDTDLARYDEYEQQRAARNLDASGAVEQLDMWAERDAALAEAEERNRPEGKVLIVTDENIPTVGLVGPMLALAGANQVRTAGVPYHQFTRDYLKGVTKSEFPEQLAFNDVNQRYTVIVLQGMFPPIKPSELIAQIGENDGDVGIVPGDVDQRFVDELLILLGDDQSDYAGRFKVETRPSRLVNIRAAQGGEFVSEARRTYSRDTYLIIRTNPDESKSVPA